MKFAYFINPHIGGTWTVFKSVREGLAPYGIDVRWLGVGMHAQKASDDPQWMAERSSGAVAGGYEPDSLAQAKALMEVLEVEHYDGVFVNAACDRVHSNVIRYLDPRIRRIMTVHSITVATYAGARALREWVHATICVSPRIMVDLTNRYGFLPNATKCIPNALNLSPFDNEQGRIKRKGPLKVIFLGRVIDVDKGVYWLPKIMDQLINCDVTLSVAGDGPDRAELERRCAHLGNRVRFLGQITPHDVPRILGDHDTYLLPSRFEGMGLGLVEAMSSGCVPVASRIRSVTDFVITDGKDGLLFDIGDTGLAANHIRNLARDRTLLAALASAARDNVRTRFELSAMAQAYAKVVESVMAVPRQIKAPLSISEWSYPAGLKPGLRTYLPEGLKNRLRVWRERFG